MKQLLVKLLGAFNINATLKRKACIGCPSKPTDCQSCVTDPSMQKALSEMKIDICPKCGNRLQKHDDYYECETHGGFLKEQI